MAVLPVSLAGQTAPLSGLCKVYRTAYRQGTEATGMHFGDGCSVSQAWQGRAEGYFVLRKVQWMAHTPEGMLLCTLWMTGRSA